MLEPTSPKFKILNPRKLEPPVEVKIVKQNKKKEALMKNKFTRFFILFFGEGF